MSERLWRPLQYAYIFLHIFETGSEVRQVPGEWIELYNTRRPHSRLDGRTPDEAYYEVSVPDHNRAGLKKAA